MVSEKAIAELRGLSAKWRKPTPQDDCTLYTMGIRSGRHDCADELAAALDKLMENRDER